MGNSSESPNAPQRDWDAVDAPELSAEDFALARPFEDVFPDQFKTWRER